MKQQKVSSKKRRDPLLHIRLRPELIAKIDELAAAEHRNRTNMIEVVLEREFGTKESLKWALPKEGVTA
jgi:predicted transcriptional regulator